MKFLPYGLYCNGTNDSKDKSDGTDCKSAPAKGNEFVLARVTNPGQQESINRKVNKVGVAGADLLSVPFILPSWCGYAIRTYSSVSCNPCLYLADGLYCNETNDSKDKSDGTDYKSAPAKGNNDIQVILKQYLRSNRVEKIIEF